MCLKLHTRLWNLILAILLVFGILPLIIIRYHSAVSQEDVNIFYKSKPSIAIMNKSNYKVAVIIPYVGKSLPSWFDTYAWSTQFSDTKFDHFIFMTELVDIIVPPNIQIIQILEDNLLDRILKLDSVTSDNSERSLIEWKKILQEVFTSFPYMLVEFKPCLGFLFQDFISHYSHWAIADLDVIGGRSADLVTESDLALHDVVTFSFGDSLRMYIRGQLSIIKNNHKMNMLWQKCSQLRHLTKRLSQFERQRYLNEGRGGGGGGRTKGWRFESAEGCFSRVVADEPNVTVLVKALQISDAFRAPPSEKTSLLLGSTLMRCYLRPLDLRLHLSNSSTLRSYISQSPDRSGEREREISVKLLWNTNQTNCANWIIPQYQVCLQAEADIREADLVYRSPGNISASIVDYNVPMTADGVNVKGNSTGQCREGALSHFQGYKNNYYHFTTRVPSNNARSMVVTSSGFVPLVLPQFSYLPTYREIFDKLIPPEPEAKHWMTHCVKFSADLLKCEGVLSSTSRALVSSPGGGGDLSPLRSQEEVTLVVALWAHDFEAGLVDKMSMSWAGPQVFVVAISAPRSSSDSDVTREKISALVHRSKYHIQVVLVDLAHKQSFSSLLPDKVLLNIGLEHIKTHNVLLAPPGFVFDSDAASILRELLLAGGGEQHEGGGGEGGGSVGKPRAYLIPSFLGCNLTSAASPSQALAGNCRAIETSHKSLRLDVGAATDIRASKSSKAIANRHLYSADRVIRRIMHTIANTSGGAGNISTATGTYENWQSDMLPVAFNVRANGHGDSFVRFPEELSGPGCFGDVMLTVLESAGYDMHWAPALANIRSEDWESVSNAGGRGYPGTVSSRCLHGDVSTIPKFVNSFYMYLVDVSRMGRGGLAGVHTTNDFRSAF